MTLPMLLEMQGERRVMNASDPSLPNYMRPELVEAKEDLDLLVHLLGGTRMMWKHSRTYIRRWADEDETTYNIRRKIEVLFGGFERTLSASIGMLYAKMPRIDWGAIETQGEADQLNIDGQGTHADVFAKRFSMWALRDGFSLILVDHPLPLKPGAAGIVTSDDAPRATPIWARYARANVLSWETRLINGQRCVVQVVLYEPGDAKVGLFGTKSVNRYRVLRLLPDGAAWSLYEQTGDAGSNVADFKLVGSGYFTNYQGLKLGRLPIEIAYTGEETAPLVAHPPLLPVGFANLAHWQISTALRFYLELCAYPQPTVEGDLAQQVGVDVTGAQMLLPGKLRVGPGIAVHLKQGGKFYWAEMSGGSIDKLEAAIDRYLHAMAKLGASFLVKDVRGVETAESKRLDSAAENASLATASQGIEKALNGAWKLHAWYLGVVDETKAPTVTLNRDFDNAVLDPQTMLAYVSAVKDANLPPRILLEAWQAGGRISPDEDLDLLEKELMAAKLAQDEAKRQAAEDLANKNTDPATDPTPTPPAA